MMNSDTMCKISLDNVRGNICLFLSEPNHDLNIKARVIKSLFITKVYTKFLSLGQTRTYLLSLCCSSLKTTATKTSAIAASTEQVFSQQVAKRFLCIISFCPHHSQQRKQGQDSYPCNPKVQKRFENHVLLKCGTKHLGAKLIL